MGAIPLTSHSEVLGGGDGGLRYCVRGLTGQRLGPRVVADGDLQLTGHLWFVFPTQHGYLDLAALESLPHVRPSERTGWDAFGRARVRVAFSHCHYAVTSDGDIGYA